MTDLARRSFLGAGLAFVACAPAIVRASSLMPVKALIAATLGLSYEHLSSEWRRGDP